MADSNVSAFDGLFTSFFQESAVDVNPINNGNLDTNIVVEQPNIESAITQTNTIIPDTNITIEQPDTNIAVGDQDQPQINFLDTPVLSNDRKLFDINTFVSELRENDAKKNKEYSLKNTNMSAYDIASGCIGNIVMKILNYPVQDYSASWLPVKMRGCIGEGVHNFIQSESDQFTETEGSMKIPSIHFSGRFDAMIGNNNLIEIKSCTYDDYKKIIKNHQPRINDFYQLITYKYILENYLEEAQRQPRDTLRTDPPRQREYNIDTLQLIFVCHQIFAADYNSIGEAIADVKAIKKLLNSKHNQFYFITALTIDLTKIDVSQYIDPVKKKIERVNYYIETNQLPDKTDEFVDTNACFFCLYKQNCPYK